MELDELKELASERDFRHHLFLEAMRRETVGLRDFILSEIIDPDGEAAKDWRDTFSLIPKKTVVFLRGLWR